MFYHGFGFGPHLGFSGGGIDVIIMFFVFMFIFSFLRRNFGYRGHRGYRGYRGYRRYQRPYQPFDPNAYQGQGDQSQQNNQQAENQNNSTQYSGYGNQPTQEDTGLKTLRTDSGGNYSAGNGTGAPTQRVNPPQGNSGEPTRPL